MALHCYGGVPNRGIAHFHTPAAPPTPSTHTQNPKQELVDDAVRAGARLLAGGKPNPAHPKGNFYLPTVRDRPRVLECGWFGLVVLALGRRIVWLALGL